VDSAPATLEEENALLRRQLTERNAELDVARAQIEALTLNLAMLRRRQFGRSSENLDGLRSRLLCCGPDFWIGVTAYVTLRGRRFRHHHATANADRAENHDPDRGQDPPGRRFNT
jgi:hypothetical protein